VRAVSQAELRVSEARRLGFHSALLPMKNYRQLQGKFGDMELFGAETIGDALKCAMPKKV
jgi:DNA repair protein radA